MFLRCGLTCCVNVSRFLLKIKSPKNTLKSMPACINRFYYYLDLSLYIHHFSLGLSYFAICFCKKKKYLENAILIRIHSPSAKPSDTALIHLIWLFRPVEHLYDVL